MTAQPHLYKHGLPFGHTLALNLDDLKARVENKKASMILIDGGVGEGKTTLAVEIADYLSGYEIDLRKPKQIAQGGVDFLQKLRICYEERLVVLVYDESGDFNKRGSLTRFNAMLNRTFETFRAFKIIVVLVLPRFSVLDQDIFDKNIPRLLLNCFKRTDKYGNYRAYSLNRMLYMRELMRKLAVKSGAYSMEMPNFYGQFKDLHPERSRALDVLSTRGKIGELRKSEIKIEGLLSKTDLAEKLLRSVGWVEMEIARLGIKTVRRIDQRNYYDMSTLERLEEVIDSRRGKADKGEGKRRGE